MANNSLKNKNAEIVVEFDTENSHVKLSPSIVQQFIVGTDSKITLAEFKFFTELCKARKLNPFLKEAYCVKYGNNPAQIIVGKDVFLKRAIRHPQYDGMESGIIVQNKKTGDIIERAGLFWLANSENLVGGWARVFRKDWAHPTYISVSFEECAQRKRDGSLNSNWAGKGATMIEKVAKVRALRESFIEEFAQMYAAEEMGVDDSGNNYDNGYVSPENIMPDVQTNTPPAPVEQQQGEYIEPPVDYEGDPFEV